MLKGLFSSIFPSRNDRELKRISRIIDRINSLEIEIRDASDESLTRKTIEFRERLSHGETLDDILPEAFSVVREASRRGNGGLGCLVRGGAFLSGSHLSNLSVQ